MKNYLDLKKCRIKRITPLSDQFSGEGPGGTISFTNYYMELDKEPYFGISGECHYSRVHEKDWEDTILKMKMGGINIISTYVFWNHHEEEEGIFRFDGCRNIRQFISLCQKHDMYVIVRIGPFDHGEVRNGGLPDWLYGKPFDVRSLNEGFMYYTKRLYQKLSEQFEGLYHKDGGPIIGTQIENEYMHSAAPWEMTTGVSNEWVQGGKDGNAYMLALKQLAREAGIITPFYTCTGWGGAATPTDEMLPLWGGYAFWPWIFYNYRGEHPVTPEYIYREYHNDEVQKTYNFEPNYRPESLPYACCEMGGGMSCFYHYRFQLPYESVDAMANIKLAGGCNFLGYYMYRGGTNPKGLRNTYLNECQCPKLSYDYQAAIGEFGQLRPSYHRLRLLHIFIKNFSKTFCKTVTVLPENSQDIEPEDVDTLRYAVRTDGNSGYVFINNYQDHMVCKDKVGADITLNTIDTLLEITDISIAAGEEAVLPFGMDMEGYQLIYAKAQPISFIKEEDYTVYFFFMPKGMQPEFVWKGDNIRAVDGNVINEHIIRVAPPADSMSVITIEGEHGMVKVVLLTREQSLQYHEIELNQKKTALLCSTAITYDGSNLLVETPHGEEKESVLLMYPGHEITSIIGAELGEALNECIWKGITIKWENKKCSAVTLPIKPVGICKYTVEVPDGYDDSRELLMQVNYQGDIGNAFVDGELISDNFCNGAVWEIGLKTNWELVKKHPVTIAITPLKQDSTVNVSSTMAGRMEENQGLQGEVESVKVKPVYQAVLTIGKDSKAL